MAVDDVAALRVEAEFLQDMLAAFHCVDVAVVRVGRLLPGALVGNQRALKRLELAPRRRREPAAPEEVHEVEGARRAMQPCLPRALLAEVEPAAAAVLLALEAYRAETAVFIERHAAVEQQIAVAAGVEIALLVEVVDVTVQDGALREVGAQVRDDLLLLCGQLVDILARLVNRREVGALELVAPAVAEPRIRGTEVDVMEQPAALHLEVVIARDELALELEHHDGDGALRCLQGRFVGVDVRGKCRQRPQADAVAALEDVGIVVAQGIAHDRRDAGLAAERRAHPEHIVVAPLDVDGRVLHEQVEDGVGPVAAVKEIADDVEPVDGQPLDQNGERLDEVRAAVNLHDGIEELLEVEELRLVGFRARVHELDDDRCVAVGDEAADLRSRILVAHELRELEQAREVLAVPRRRRAPLCAHLVDLLLRVVDERAELRLLVLRQPHAEDVVDLLANDAGAVVEDVEKRGVLAVQVAHEVLDALRQREVRLQVDELLVNGFFCWVFLGHEAQDLARLLRVCAIVRHRDSPSLIYPSISYLSASQLKKEKCVRRP